MQEQEYLVGNHMSFYSLCWPEFKLNLKSPYQKSLRIDQFCEL